MGPKTGAGPLAGDDVATKNAFRVRVALIMAAVSLASAYVTFIASERASEASGLESLASQQWAEEQQAAQQIDAQITQEQTLTARLDIVQHAYATSLSDARRIAGSDPQGAAEFFREGQEAAALYVQLTPFFRAGAPTAAADGLTYDTSTAEDLLRVQDARLYRASSALTRAEADAAANASSQLGATIVMLVAALFILTLAHIAGPERGTSLAWIGGVVALAGVAWFTALAIGEAIPLLIGTALTIGILAAVRVPRIAAWLNGLETAAPSSDGVSDRPGAMAEANPSPAPTARFDRAIVVVIAVATLLGAGVGYLHSQAARSSEQLSWTANDDGVASIGALRSDEAALAVQLSDYEEALDHRVASWNATQRALTARAAGDTVAAAAQAAVAQESAAAAARLEERSGLADVLGTTGVAGQDTLIALHADVWYDTARTIGEQDAANTASRNWGERAGWYLSVLAWLAVAVYLLGLALAFKDGRARLVLAGMGVILVVLALGQSARAVTAPPPVDAATATRAAEAYATGFVALQKSRSDAAEEAFTRALALRPDFGIASRERASAILSAGSAEGLGLRSGFTDRAVDRAIADLESARSHGADTAGVLLNLGAMLFHRAINTESVADMRASVEASRAGLALGGDASDPDAPPHVNAIIGRLNLALALLGVGEEAAARREYSKAGNEIHKLPAFLRPYLVGAGVGAIDLLDRGPVRATAERIQAMKDEIVAAAYALPETSSARVGEVTAEVYPAQVQWNATITDFDPARDRLAVQWYRLDHGIGEWGAVPLLSGPLTFEQGDFGGLFFRRADGTYWGNSSATLVSDVPPSCVRPGSYRVELYLNGHLAGSASVGAPKEQSQYEPILSRDVGFAMCGLSGWTVEGTDGVSRGVHSPDRQRSIDVYRVQQAAAPGADAYAGAIDRLLRAGDGGVSATAHEVDAGVGHPAIFGGKPAVWRAFTDGGRRVVYAAVQLASGTVLVARIAGDAAWVESAEAWQLVGSTAVTSE